MRAASRFLNTLITNLALIGPLVTCWFENFAPCCILAFSSRIPSQLLLFSHLSVHLLSAPGIRLSKWIPYSTEGCFALQTWLYFCLVNTELVFSLCGQSTEIFELSIETCHKNLEFKADGGLEQSTELQNTKDIDSLTRLYYFFIFF